MNKRIAFINVGKFGSTGRIMQELSECAERNGYDTIKCYPDMPLNIQKDINDYIICENTNRKINNLLEILTGYPGSFSYFNTLALIEKLKDFKPDIIHLHNIHSSFINYNILFKYIKTENKKTVWTLHDCWAFTGRCPYFEIVKCNKWLTGCCNCPYSKSSYPRSLFDYSSKMWKKKQLLYKEYKNLYFVTPSNWLSNLVKKSFLQNHICYTINNGINLDKFMVKSSRFREKYHLKNKIIILGVAFGWTPRKGINDFKRLAIEMPNEYAMVLVGVTANIASSLPKNIISISRTQSQEELSEIYSAADIFVNPTLEDNFPTVNLEALACGTPVITYETGGSPESITKDCGRVVPYGDYEALKKAIIELKDAKASMQDKCIERAKLYRKEDKYEEYISLYEKLTNSNEG